MTLEHIPATGDFVRMVRRAIGDAVRNRPVFFQIPEATRILRDCAFEDIYYEHCSYFSPAPWRGCSAPTASTCSHSPRSTRGST